MPRSAMPPRRSPTRWRASASKSPSGSARPTPSTAP